MAFFTSRFAAATALAASLAMAASPVAAAQLSHAGGAKAPVPAAKSWSVESETAHRHRGGWGGGYGGGYGGWGGHRHHHHGDGIDGGDVLAGVLILGGIAAIASAASNNSRDRDRESEPDREPDVYYRNGDNRTSGYDGSGLDNAADMCVQEIERSEPVNSVDSVERIGSGWEIEGKLSSGRNFRCNIDNSGKVSRVELDDKVSANTPQWNDDAYARARAARDAQSDDGGQDEGSDAGG